MHAVQSVVNIDIQTHCVHCSKCDTHANGGTDIAAGSKYLLKDSLIPQMVADDRTVVVHFMPTVPVDRSRLESKVVVRVRPGGFLVRDPMESIELGTYVVYRKCLCCRI